VAVPVRLHLRDLRRRGRPLTALLQPASPLVRGLIGRCPNCGGGRLFAGFLTVSPRCDACGYDLAKGDSGDGPAVFVILIGGFFGAFGALFTEFTFHPPVWATLLIWLPLTLFVCLALLRPFKGVMLAAQFMNNAAEARRDD
jgi:uncharacterized protein (DUF983 family)